MKKIYIFIILAVFGFTGVVNAQQYPYFYQYLLNKYALSPTYAGIYGVPEAYLSYRQSRINVNYAPRTIDFNFNAPISNKVGLGLNFMNDKSDIFSNTYAIASYTYHLQVAENHRIDFSVTAGMIQKKVDLSGVINDPMFYNDPVINGRSQINETSTEIGAGLLYRFKSLNVGVWTPSLYENNATYNAFNKHFIAHASYDYKLNDNWNLEPIAIARITEKSPVNFDISVLARYHEKYLAAVTFKRNTVLGFSLGADIVKNVPFMYTYDMPLPRSKYIGVLGDDFGGHEITIGYRFGKRTGTPTGPAEEDDMSKALKGKARVTQVDSLADLTRKLNDQVKQLADSLNSLKKNKPDNLQAPDIKNLEEQIKLLNERLLKQSGLGAQITEIAKVVYFVTGSAEITDYSKRKLDELIDALKKYPTVNLIMEGHTDDVGSDEFNMKLSQNRVEGVKKYLTGKGIAAERIKTSYYGKTRPVSSNETPEGRQKNRRVEMRGE